MPQRICFWPVVVVETVPLLLVEAVPVPVTMLAWAETPISDAGHSPSARLHILDLNITSTPVFRDEQTTDLRCPDASKDQRTHYTRATCCGKGGRESSENRPFCERRNKRFAWHVMPMFG